MSEPTPRTRVIREHERGVYDREAVYKILDAGFICHVGFVQNDQPFVIPTGYGRLGDQLYIHGSAASRMLKEVNQGIPICVTVTLLDGLVLARSIFNHSMNYRSVVILGRATIIDDPTEKLEALRQLSEHVIPGRWAESRPPNERELKATTILKLPIEEFSAKVRQGDVVDDAEDMTFPVWAGILPLPVIPGAPVPDQNLDPKIAVPGYVKNYSRE